MIPLLLKIIAVPYGRWSYPLQRKCRLLLEADLQSKSSAGNTDLLLECLLINLCTVH